MENNITKRDYYKELHSASRNYNTKLWTIPGLFILVLGFMWKEFNFGEFVSLGNLFLLIGGGAIIFMLLLQSLKDSFFQISIQKKINDLEENELNGLEKKVMPIYSATDTQITRRFQELKENFDSDRNKVKFSLIREFLTRIQVSRIFFLIVYISLILVFCGVLLITISKLIEVINN